MKIAESAFEQDGKLVVRETHDFNHVIDKASLLRAADKHDFGESRLVGVIDPHMWTMWARKWGVSPSDNDAMRAVVKRELLNSDNSKLRVWRGNY